MAFFSGTSVGTFNEETELLLNDKVKNKRHTRLDMNFLVGLTQHLAKHEAIKPQLLFYLNSSVYKIGDQLRYVEYNYINGRRIHNIVAFESNTYLEKIAIESKNGLKVDQLSNLLIDDEIDHETAKAFIDELILNQFLMSELEPSVSGEELLEQILSILEKLDNTSDILVELNHANDVLHTIDQNIGNATDNYLNLKESLDKLGVKIDLKYLFQTDLVIVPIENKIGKSVLEKVRRGLNLYNKLSVKNHTTDLSKFATELFKRYEHREVSLLKVLDTETGIGYKDVQGDPSPLVDNLILPVKINQNLKSTFEWSKAELIFQNQLLETFEKNQYVLELDALGFEDLPASWEDLPATFSSIIKIVCIDGIEKIVMNFAGGSSAANLLGRFCYGDETLSKFVQQIVDKEEALNPTKILAEIIHLPESRVGNILSRPSFRAFEIPYLAKSNLDKSNQLDLTDLLISCGRNNEVILKSKIHNKVVQPHLSNAHNYSYNSLPIYNFLCDLQTQGKRGYLGPNLSFFLENYPFIPRIEYDNIILSLATWNIAKKDIKKMVEASNKLDELIEATEKWRQNLKMPQYVLLIEGDNELLINLKNVTSIRMLLNAVKHKSNFKLTEFIFENSSLIKDQSGEDYTNQVVVSFYKNDEIANRN